MNFNLNSSTIDAIIAIILVFMIVVGYLKGFIYRLYDLLSTILALLVALYLSVPLSTLYKLYKVEGLASNLADSINRFIFFIIIFIISKVILGIIGKIVKPLLKGAVNSIGLFAMLDQGLGMVVSFIEGIIMIYLGLTLIIMPLNILNQQEIDNSFLGKHILQLVPSVTSEIGVIVSGINIGNEIIKDGINYDSFDSNSLVMMVNSLNTVYNHGVISDEVLIDLLNRYGNELNNVDQEIVLNNEQYNQVSELLQKVAGDNFDSSIILNKIVVSE